MTERYEPANIDDICGQDTSLFVLSSLIENNLKQKLIILNGPDGVGKTCIAKRFSDRFYLNKIMEANQSLSFYHNYNSNIFILKPLNVLQNDHGVINIEYMEDMPFSKQAELYEFIDNDARDDVTYILSTNNITKLLPQIKNRALVLDLTYLSDKIIRDRLSYISNKESFEITDDEINEIVIRAKGNMRLALSILDRYAIFGKDSFNKAMLSPRKSLMKLIGASLLQNKDESLKSIEELMTFPLQDIKASYESLVLEILQIRTTVKTTSDSAVKALNKLIGNKILKLFDILNNKIIYDMFNNYTELQSALWYIYIRIGDIEN